MIMVIFSIASILIVGAAVAMKRMNRKGAEIGNKELEIFYEMEDEPQAAQMRQLIKAARASADAKEAIEKKIESVSQLHDDKLVSDDYINGLTQASEELVIEKILIENEAEMLRPGARDTIFAEAARLPAQPKELASKKKSFDEALYIKRKEMLVGALRAKLTA